MAWLQVHQTLKDHRKLFDAADQLEVEPPHMMGLLVSFWLWALDNAPTGSLVDITPRMISRAAQWDGDPEKLAKTLIRAGWIDEKEDGTLEIHDWYEYAGKLIDQRQAEKERSRSRRAAAAASADASPDDPTPTAGRPANSRKKAGGRVDQSREDKTREGSTPPSPSDEGSDGGTKSLVEARFLEFWKAYPKKTGKQYALKAWNKIKPTAELHERIMQAVDAQKRSDQWRRENGRYIPNPSTWLNGGYPSNSVTLVTNQIIKMLCFDATEPSNGNSDRCSYGNNRYIYSNLRQWLNSPAAAGQWYTAQHSADQTPDSSHVWSGYNAYSGIAGFLNAFTANERAALLNTTITVGKSSTDGGGTETCTDKIFPLSCTEVGLSGDHVCGSKLAIFSDNNSRIATVTASCVANSNYSSNPGSGAAWYYWLRDAYAGSAISARCVNTDGTLNWINAYYGNYGLRPACNLSSDLLISDSVDSDGCYTVIYNQAPTAPSSITVPSEVLGGENLSISWAASTDPDGNLSGYVLERKVGSGTWAQIYKGSSRSYTDAITYGWTSVQYRVKAYDAAGAESAYTTSVTRTVINNRPPVISGTDGALGSFSTAAPSYEYTVTDADGHQVDVAEMLDGVTLRSYTVTLGQTNTLTIGSEAWLKVVNGSHTLKIVATDAKDASVTRTLTFTKAVTSVEFEQTLAMEADAMPTKALVNIQGNFPAGCTLQVWICNNGNDASPTWEDITQKVRTGQKHYFTNKTKTASAWGVKVKAKLLRGSATETCYIQSIGGNFA